jgi:hypothetical protein
MLARNWCSITSGLLNCESSVSTSKNIANCELTGKDDVLFKEPAKADEMVRFTLARMYGIGDLRSNIPRRIKK